MGIKFIDRIQDFRKNETRNFRAHQLAAAPSGAVTGQVYYDTALNKLFWYNGTSWIDATGGAITFGNVTAQTSFGASSTNGVASTGARSDHAHGTPTHDNAAHSGIALSALAVPTASLSLNSQKIINLGTGTLATDAVNLQQVQDLINTGTNKTSVRVASTANIAVASALTNSSVIDGVTVATGDRVLLKNQTTTSENGIWVVVASGAATRATDADISAEVKGGLSVWVNQGTANADTRWVLTTDDPITLGTTGLTFVQDFAANALSAGAGLTASGGVLNVGAGTGISVAADTVGIDPAVVARKTTPVLIGDGTTTSFTVTHNFNNVNVELQVRDTTTGDDYEPNVTSVTTNAITYAFTVAPTTNQLSVSVIG